MTLRSNDLQSDSDLDSIRNSCEDTSVCLFVTFILTSLTGLYVGRYVCNVVSSLSHTKAGWVARIFTSKHIKQGQLVNEKKVLSRFYLFPILLCLYPIRAERQRHEARHALRKPQNVPAQTES